MPTVYLSLLECHVPENLLPPLKFLEWKVHDSIIITSACTENLDNTVYSYTFSLALTVLYLCASVNAIMLISYPYFVPFVCMYACIHYQIYN